MAKFYTVDEIRNNLNTNDQWLVRGLLAIYAKQTADEQDSESTSHSNGQGFNGTDAEFLSSCAKQVLGWQATENPRYNRPLSDKQFVAVRRKMNKYAGQLFRIADQKEPEGYTPPSSFVEKCQAAKLEAKRERDARLEEIEAELQAKRERDAYQAELEVAEAEAAAERAAIQAEEFDGEPVEALAW